MSSDEFKAKAYVKEKCPFSFKFLVFMAEAGLKPDAMPVLSFYKQTIFPQLIELFQIKHPKTAKSA